MIQLLADEIGHVGYIAAVLGPRGRAVVRALFGREALERRFAADLDLEALAAEVPGLAYVAAPV